jgi:hypothetical protein
MRLDRGEVLIRDRVCAQVDNANDDDDDDDDDDDIQLNHQIREHRV